MKTLPSLYKNENVRFKDNNKTNCIIKESINDNVLDTIKDIFNSNRKKEQKAFSSKV